jgi:hypothetical protein
MWVNQSAVKDLTDDVAREGLRKRVDDWFVKHGVPQFAERYTAGDQLHYLVLPLAVLVAFEVGAAPKLRSLPALLVVPPVVVGLTAWARPFVWRLLGHKQESATRPNWWRLVGLLAMLAALSVVLVWLSDWPPPWSDAWVDFGVILLAEFAAMAVFTKEVWSGAGRQLDSLRRWLVACTVGGVLFFGVLLTLDQGAAIDSRRLLNDLVPGGYRVPLALPALVCMMFILALAYRASDAAGSSTGKASPWIAVCYPALPLLVLVLAAQTTVLREAHALGWARVWLPLGVAVILFALSAAAWWLSSTAWWTTCTSTTRRWLSLPARRWRSSHRRERHAGTPVLGRAAWDRIFQGAGHPLFLAPLLAASLIGYPAKAGAGIGIEFFGWNVVLGTVAVLMFAIYVVLVWFFVWFGLDQVGVWVWREIRNDAMQIVQGVAGGLPMLLVFAAFFVLTAETWEFVVKTSTTKFLSLVGLLVALTLGVLVLLANQQLGHAQWQLTTPEPLDPENQPGNGQPLEPWQRLRQQALREKGPSRDEPTMDTVRELFDATSKPPKDQGLSPALEPRMRVNALLVMAAYQALVLVPVGLGALLLLWGVGRLAVTTSMAAQWIYGDNAGKPEELLVDKLSFLGEPWTRVPVVLAAFSVLYLSVTLLTNQEQRTYFFSAASEALRQRLAVRVAYRLYLDKPAPAADMAEEEGAASAAMPVQHQLATVTGTIVPIPPDSADGRGLEQSA